MPNDSLLYPDLDRRCLEMIDTGVEALHCARPHPQSVSAASSIHELDMDRDVIPFHRNALELRRRWRELHPGANRYRGALRSRGLSGEVNLHRREPYRAWGAGDLLGTRRHLLVDAICVATVGTHEATLEHTFDFAVWQWSLPCGKTAGGFARRVYP